MNNGRDLRSSSNVIQDTVLNNDVFNKQIILMMEQDDYFIAADKETIIETLQYTQKNKRKSNHKLCRKQNDLIWKFQSTKQYYISPPPNNINPSAKNISFQTQQFSDDQQSPHNQYSSDKEIKSPLSFYYKSFSPIYMKKKNIGTHYIGNREYFSSIFIDPQKIQRSSLVTFSPFNNNISSVRRISDCTFDSQFESGNLFAAYKIGADEYDLVLQNDINTKGNTQWFYFRVLNLKPNQNIKINIVNLMKSDSLFNYGMLPCVHSMQAEIHTGQGWVRSGSKVTYTKTTNQIQQSKRFYYCLSFEISTNYVNDVLKIAHCYPYTVSDLNYYINNIVKNNEKRGIIERMELGKTIGKNPIEVITIKQANPRKKTRDIMVILARQHPGQTPSSFVCEGFVDFLLSKDKEAEYLRKNCEFKIIPMLNPDGVYVGNYRSNLLGVDLNRRWSNGEKDSNFLESIMVKNYLTELGKKSDINFILDLHGHSRKLFSFFYGNTFINDPVAVRMFPYLCSKLSSNMIRFQDSTFCYSDGKRKTARIQLNLNFKIPNIFTFQTSFLGYINKDSQKKQFTPQSYRNLGLNLGRALFIQERQKYYQDCKEAIFYKKLLSDLKTYQYLLKSGDNDDSGSQSNPSECQIGERQMNKLQGEIDDSRGKAQFIKKIIKKELLSKQITRVPRALQIFDIPRVHSVFPNDVLALIPNSYLNKEKKQFKGMTTQTEQMQFLKIYQACKSSELNLKNDPRQQSPIEKKTDQVTHKGSNLFKTVIRPRSSTYNVLNKQSNHKQKRISNEVQGKQIRYQSSRQMKKSKINQQSKHTQTILTFMPKLRIYFIEEQSKLEIKNNSTLKELMIHSIQQRKLAPKNELKPAFRTLNAQFSIKKKINY